MAQGTTKDVLARGEAPIAKALAAPRAPRVPSRTPVESWIRVKGATFRNLDGISVSFRNPGLTCVTGVSGAGKSTLVFDVLGVAARSILARAPFPAGRLRALEGLGPIDRVAASDGIVSAHPRAMAGGVLGVLDPLRGLFAATVEARARGYGPRRFSTNVDGGRCAECRGLGIRAVRLRHLPELAAPCEACEGRRFRPETLEIRVKGLSIADVLEMPLSRAAEVFRDLPGRRTARSRPPPTSGSPTCGSARRPTGSRAESRCAFASRRRSAGRDAPAPSISSTSLARAFIRRTSPTSSGSCAASPKRGTRSSRPNITET